MSLLAGLDVGTTTIKAVLYDSETGRVVSTAGEPTPVNHPRPEWSEHDPQQLWEAACRCLRATCAGKSVQALAIASMAEAGVALDSQDRPVAPVIAWHDRRSSPQATRVEECIGRETLFRISGQRVTASFGLTKWLWLRDQQPDLARQAHWWLPLPAYLLFRLTGERAVDYSIASRALLFGQNMLDWSAPLLDLAGLTRANLPGLAPGGSAAGRISPLASSETGLPAGTKCALGGHDHLCAALAAGGMHSGAAVDSMGSAEAVMLFLPAFLPDPTLGEHGYACYAHVLPGQFVLKAGLKAAGSSIEWLGRLLSGGSEADYAALEAEARATLGKSGPLWLPHLLESGSPEADPLSRGALAGARLDHTRGDLFRGMLEGLACWLRQNLSDMQAAAQVPAQSLSLLGGTTRLALLSQIKADVLNMPVEVPQIPQAAAVGAALLAGLGSGVFSSVTEALASLRYPTWTLQPAPDQARRYEHLYWQVYTQIYPSLRAIHHAL